ncbi:hypothetical protein M3Y94_00608400 [Aphelenchoides besseyi]|nr:hypothetical protein M3Y94_00608400 [Aphelenchoides besseyi]KAI6218875.1 hypothetical protein M3Y95_01134300 [Aphelenchoides besseyi]
MELDLSTWVNLVLFVIVWITFVSQFELLHRQRKLRSSDRLSGNILLNILLWTITAAVGIVYSGYLVFSPQPRYGYFIFVSGILWIAFSSAASMSVFFLLIDRIEILVRPVGYLRSRSNFLTITTVFCVGITIFDVVMLIWTELPIDKVSYCTTLGCVLTRNHAVVINLVKMIIGFSNMFVSLLFELILWKYSAMSKVKYRKANFVSLTAAFTEFLCNVVPNTMFRILTVWQVPGYERLGVLPALMIGK